jgi:hypothetical protein
MILNWGYYKGQDIEDVLKKDPAYVGYLLRSLDLECLTQEQKEKAMAAFEQEFDTSE